MSEYWIEVKGHPRYMVSTMGRVKCLDYYGSGKEKILKLSVRSKKTGYLSVYIDGKRMSVHRLVLESFMPNPERKPEVEHINTIKTDCRIENLKWVYHKENQNNPLTRKHLSENNAKPWLGKMSKKHSCSKPIIQLTKNGIFVKKWDCSMDVFRELGINFKHISECCRNIYGRKTAGGYKWKYASDYQRKSISEIKPLF